MSEQATDRVWSSIDFPKTIAGVLAAVSAAVVGSFLGVAGTLVGAALASIVGTVGTEVYHRGIARGRRKIATFVTAPAAVGTPTVAAADDESPSQPEPGEATDVATPTKMRWGRVASIAGAVFVLAMGTLTAFELITGKSAADAVGHHTNSTTTICSVFCSDKKTDQVNTPASTPASTGAPATDGTKAPATGTATTGSTPSAAPTDTATPQPTATDTQNSNGGGQAGQGKNNVAPPATQQP
jgi:hypothetical protein